MSEVSQALPIGTKVAGYEVARVLGIGGFGITYEGVSPVLGKKVAIKEFFPLGVATRRPDGSLQYAAEARELVDWALEKFKKTTVELATLDHPNIVKVLNYTSDNNTGYMAMELVEGQTLAHLLRRPGWATPDHMRRCLVPVMEALAYLHQKGFIHRDIAPDNVMIRSDGRPMLIDFGALKPVQQDVQAHVTHAVAKKYYAPPEQLLADSRLTPATDIYGLAAVLYRAFTGEPPVDAETRKLDIARGGIDPYMGIGRRTAGKIPLHLAAAIDRGLSFRAEDRPQSVEAFLNDLGWMERPAAPQAPQAPIAPGQQGIWASTEVVAPPQPHQPTAPVTAHVPNPTGTYYDGYPQGNYPQGNATAPLPPPARSDQRAISPLIPHGVPPSGYAGVPPSAFQHPPYGAPAPAPPRPASGGRATNIAIALTAILAFIAATAFHLHRINALDIFNIAGSCTVAALQRATDSGEPAVIALRQRCADSPIIGEIDAALRRFAESREAATLAEAAYDRAKLDAYLRDCKVCRGRGEAQERIAQLGREAQQLTEAGFDEAKLNTLVTRCRACLVKFEAQQRLDRVVAERVEYTAAGDDPAKLDAYRDKCIACIYKQEADRKIAASRDATAVRERQGYEAVRGDRLKLAEYLRNCPGSCLFRNDAEAELKRLEAADFGAAGLDPEKLRTYDRSCVICEFRVAARERLATIESCATGRPAFRDGRVYCDTTPVSRNEENEYNNARGKLLLLRRYVETCKVCAHKQAANQEIGRLEAEAREAQLATSAEFCIRSGNPCQAEACARPFLTAYPNSPRVALIRQLLAQQQALCAPRPGNQTNPRTNNTAVDAPQTTTQAPPAGTTTLVLTDGEYVGERGYTNPRGTTCRANYAIATISVRGSTIEFSSDGYTWAGSINQNTGQVVIPWRQIRDTRGRNPTAPTSITGPWQNAALFNRDCGDGFFRVLRAK